MAKKPYENKHFLDPGRLRHNIAFYRLTSTDDGYGGSDVSETLLCETKASKQRISTSQSLGESQQMVTDAGATAFNQDMYFVIRHRKGFFPKKNDKVIVDGSEEYTINGIIPLDDPLSYIRLLCVRKV
ncbi:phage head closure protein [Sphingobacterium sp. SGG-5]|uniref:phage head closure protein n=1 Tax=Sphingobacterium sp. SGG-5 TaxID=2710881 RepID=UPI0013EB3895|nr:phage head closure protein [Sphingobacterium sp. SGG-5]NGM63503.1 phage head closure protein [Sphingobacterium sp. SGG-5]